MHPVQVPGGDKRVSTSTGDPPDLTLTGLDQPVGGGWEQAGMERSQPEILIL